MVLIDIYENDKLYTAHLLNKKEGTDYTTIVLDDGTEKDVLDEKILINYNTEDYITLVLRQERAYELYNKQGFDKNFIEKYVSNCTKTQDKLVVKIQTEIMNGTINLTDLQNDNIGVRLIKNAVPKELCDAVNDSVNIHFENRKQNDCEELNYGEHRYNLKLKQEGVVDEMIKYIDKNIIKRKYKTKTVTCFVSEPGATRQPIHKDFFDHNSFCIFVALQDITEDMGPPVFIPSSNDDTIFNDYIGNLRIGSILYKPKFVATIKKGDAISFDVRTLHAGLENKSIKRRNIMTITYFN